MGWFPEQSLLSKANGKVGNGLGALSIPWLILTGSPALPNSLRALVMGVRGPCKVPGPVEMGRWQKPVLLEEKLTLPTSESDSHDGVF